MNINQDLNKKLYSYPSIEQYRNLIHHISHKARLISMDENGTPIYDNNKELPTLSFEGTVKLHGTNAGIVIDNINNEIYFQSHHHIITPTKDNAGFALYASNIQQALREHIYYLFPILKTVPVIVLYGEWCGGNIQAGIGLNQLPKMFVLFDICSININDQDNSKLDYFWFSRKVVSKISNHNENFYNIYEFPTYTIDIDLNHPELYQNKLGELTQQVEDECPVTKSFGFEKTIGEGIVWRCTTPGYEDTNYRMKVKGEKHSSSKVKTLVPVDIEKLENLDNFVENVVTPSRCIQALHVMLEEGKSLDKTCLGDFIRWIYNDVIKEEMDTIVGNQLNPKTIGQAIGKKAKKWFFENELNFKNLV